MNADMQAEKNQAISKIYESASELIDGIIDDKLNEFVNDLEAFIGIKEGELVLTVSGFNPNHPDDDVLVKHFKLADVVRSKIEDEFLGEVDEDELSDYVGEFDKVVDIFRASATKPSHPGQTQ